MAAAMEWEWTITYSKDAHKKPRNRKWLDGFLKVSGSSFELKSEEGQQLVADAIPQSADLPPAEGDELDWLAKDHNIIVIIGDLASGQQPLPTSLAANPLQTRQPNGIHRKSSFTAPLVKPRTTFQSSATAPLPLLQQRLGPTSNNNTNSIASEPQHEPARRFRKPEIELRPLLPQREDAALQQQQQNQHQQQPQNQRAGRSLQEKLGLFNFTINTQKVDAPVVPLQEYHQQQQQQDTLVSGSSVPLSRAPFQQKQQQPPQQPPLPAAHRPQFQQQSVPHPLPPAATASNALAYNNYNTTVCTNGGFTGNLARSSRPMLTTENTTTTTTNNNNNGYAAASSTYQQRFNTTAGPTNRLHTINSYQNINKSKPYNLHTAPPAAAAPPPALGIRFPSLEECSRPCRVVEVPRSFTSAVGYAEVWKKALVEEINLRIIESASAYHSAAGKEGTTTTTAGGGGDQRQLESHFRKHGVQYYGDCELFMWKNYASKKPNAGKGAPYKRKRKKADDTDYADADEDDDQGSNTTQKKPESKFYLTLKSGRTKTAQYRKNDLWLISSHSRFQSGLQPGQPGDRNRAPWVKAARSMWHGPNKDGKFEIEFLAGLPPNLSKSQAVYALKGPDVSMELSLLDLLHNPTALATLPILPFLLGNHKSAAIPVAPSLPEGAAVVQVEESMKDDQNIIERLDHDNANDNNAKSDEDAVAVIQRFNLNPEQAAVVWNISNWCNTPPYNINTNSSSLTMNKQAAPPVCLIHGPFGSGKSTLLVAILHYILAKRGQQGSPLAGSRVLLSAHTNVAVDRVLESLLDSGCNDFLRLGSLRRISKRLFSQSLHCSESSTASAGAAAELKELLRQTTNPSEQAIIQSELAAAAQGAERQRKKLLKSVPIVGITCCSAQLPVLEGHTFDVVLLDECSQIIEPLSLAPLLQARCKYLIAAGDPLQLPPVIASPAALSKGGLGGGKEEKAGLLRPLFSRLVGTFNRPPHFLRQQYRCHPSIAALANVSFYGGRLLDGCRAEEKKTLIPHLPNLVFLDVRGQEQYSGRSVCNPQEASAVVNIVKQLLSLGLNPSQIGVICFYRAQVAMIENQLKRLIMAPPPGAAPAPAPAMEVVAKLTENVEPEQAKPQSIESAGDEASEESDSSLIPIKKPNQTNKENQVTPTTNPAAAAHSNTDFLPLPRKEESGTVQVATVDAFQGAEKDLIILSTATTNPTSFASDACRLNVALTRGRSNLIVVGCGPALQRGGGAVFQSILKAAQEGGGYAAGGALPWPSRTIN